jgi:hypothetical protein
MRLPRRIGLAALGVLAMATLLAVFALYTRPGFLLQLADQVWACF